MENQEKGFVFHYEGVEEISWSDHIKDWLLKPFSDHQKTIDNIDVIFCTDDYLLEINKTHLDHDYYTDIITFPLQDDPIEANVFISIERVKENAELYKVSFDEELHRVMIHGMLHLCGYGDKTDTEKSQMRSQEDHYLARRPQ